MPIDPTKLQPPHPASVARSVVEFADGSTGYGMPTKEVLDQEHEQWAWLKALTVEVNTAIDDINREVTHLTEDTMQRFSQKLSITDFSVTFTTELESRYANGDIVSQSILTDELTTYATKTEAGAIAQTTLNSNINNGTIYSAATVEQRVQTRTTPAQAQAEAGTRITAEIGESTGRLYSRATVNNLLTGYTTPTQARSQAQLEISAQLGTTLQGKLTQTQLVNIDAVTGIRLNYSMIGYIDGNLGGFVFQGVRGNDPEDQPVFTTIFYSDVEIYGNLIVSGTIGQSQVTNPGLQIGAVGRSATASGGAGFAQTTLTTRANSHVTMIATFDAVSSFGSVGQTLNAMIDGGIVKTIALSGAPIAVGSGYSAQPTTVVYTFDADSIGIGAHAFGVSASIAGAVSITVIELARAS